MLEHLAKHPKNKLFKNTDQSLSSNTSEYEASSTRSKSHTSTCIWDPDIQRVIWGKIEKLIIINRKFTQDPQPIEHVLLHWTSLPVQSQEMKFSWE